ncbi:MAG: NAD(P)H-hydrate dehydratase [Limimaricola sp.]|nr:NAD(P)H-hydrate dehydratase [Limimaricola sp.]
MRAELLTSAQMRAVEQAAIECGAASGLDLMERAGRRVVQAVFAQWPELAAVPQSAIVLCGPGNNGGDGFVIARLLKDWGWEVELHLYGDPEKLPMDARANFDRWCGMGSVRPWDDAVIASRLGDFVESRPETLAHQLVVDALFGTGMDRSMPEDTRLTRHACEATVLQISQTDRPKVVAVDVPSGLCADSGANFGAFPADLTVTFHKPRRGHYLLRDGRFGGGPGLSGRLRVVDIGLPVADGQGDVALAVPDLAQLAKAPLAHKYGHGHAVIVSGGVGHGGAARLAARGALRIGAGLVTLCCPAAALAENAAQLTAIMLRKVDDAAGLTRMLEDERINALCLGPGLGIERARALVPVALAAKRATVLDADALTAFAEAPEELLAQLHPDCVLTPHGGEFARLFPDIAARLAAALKRGPIYSKVDAARAAAARAGCVVLLKGPDTVIASPDGQCRISAACFDRAAPWLATAGAGDVLAGFIVGLLARGFDPVSAAETAAVLHVDCARRFGPGLIAEDLPEELPKVLQALLPPGT